MSKSNHGKSHACDLEIDRTFHRLLRSPRSSEIVNSSRHKSSVFAFDSIILKYNNIDFDSVLANSDSNLGVCISKFILDNMDDNNRTLKELPTLDIICQPWSQSYELKYGLIHLFCKFHGLPSEDPYKNLKVFHGTRNLISNMIEHPIDACPTLQETKSNNAEVATVMDACITGFLRGFGQADGYKKNLVSTKYDCYNSGLANTNWTIGHHCESTIVQRFWTDSLSNHS
ncbi:hypothetical protein CR513_22259, partial [Mucuna pruriens]